MARLATHIWVSAWLMRLEAQAVPFVLTRGAAENGAVLVRVATLDGNAALWQRVLDFESGAYRWQSTIQGPEAEIDIQAKSALANDPDLWLVEIDDAQGRHLLDELE